MEPQNETERIEAYLALFGRLQQRTGDDAIAVAILEQLGKDARQAKIQQHERGVGNGGEAPATPKQLGLLRSLGGTLRPGLTKREASAEIDRLRTGSGQ